MNQAELLSDLSCPKPNDGQVKYRHLSQQTQFNTFKECRLRTQRHKNPTHTNE